MALIMMFVQQVREVLNLSYKNSDELNQIIDTQLPGRLQFQHREVLEFYSHEIIECLRAPWGDPDFANDLILEPERLYADEDMTIRIYHDMNTGKWWWDTQVCIFVSYHSLLFFNADGL